MSTSVFERVGGFARVRLIVAEFYDRLLESPRLRGYFEHVDMRRLIDHQTKLISAIMGGPASFTDDHLARAHAHMGITGEEYDEMIEIFRETLEDFGVEGADVEKVCAHLVALRPVIVGGARVPAP